MKVMIDTNVIISAALFPNGRAAEAFFKAMMPPYEPIVCDYIVDELHRKFREKFIICQKVRQRQFLYVHGMVRRDKDLFSLTRSP